MREKRWEPHVSRLNWRSQSPYFTRLWQISLGASLAALIAAHTAAAQTLFAMVPLEPYGQAIAVNPKTHKIFVVGEPGNSLSEIDTVTLQKTVIRLGPTKEKSLNAAVRVDVKRNRIYVTNVVDDNVAVVDGATHEVRYVPVGRHPTTLEINPKTHRIYVANSDGDSVTVIDGHSLKAQTLRVGTSPSEIGINAKTNTIYVTNSHSGDVSVIHGNTGGTETVACGSYPHGIVVNQKTNEVFVGNLAQSTVTLIHGRTLRTETIPVNQYPFSMAINERTNKIYLNHQALDTITVIDGRTKSVKSVGSGIVGGSSPNGIAVDELRNRIYVAAWTTHITVIDGATNETSTIENPGYNTHAIIANSRADEFYTLNVTTNISNKYPTSSLGVFAERRIAR